MLSDVMVPMPDGVRLATDVWLPDTAGPHPIVMERTPYGKTLQSRSEVDASGREISRAEMAAHFTAHGIGVVFQDCRGRHGSEGVFTKYVNEAEDGAATMAWLLAQPWCNGRVGTMGLSYAAHTQLALACLNPPGLQTMVLDSGGFANAYRCGIRQGGAFELKQATWAYRQARLARGRSGALTASEADDLRAWFARMPWARGDSPLSDHPEYEEYLFEQWEHGTFDEHWDQPGLCAETRYEAIPDIPMLWMSSWYDVYAPSTVQNFAAMSGGGRTAPQRLIMGPWLHGDRTIPHAGDADFGQEAVFDGSIASSWRDCRIDWFAEHLLETGTAGKTRADIFVMGAGTGARTSDGRIDAGGTWQTFPSWPVPEARELSLRLGAGGTLTTAGEPQDGEASAPVLVADPARPVPTIGGALTSGQPIFSGGVFDQREQAGFFGSDGSGRSLADREDVLTFRTAPLEEDLTLIGPVRLRVWVRSDGPDCDIAATLIDEHPPSADWPEGFALNLCHGITRVRYRESFTYPRLLEDGEIAEVTVEVFPTAALLRAGHRLRLDLAGSRFPHFDVNPNTGAAEGVPGPGRVAHTEIFTDDARPSQLEISVLPTP